MHRTRICTLSLAMALATSPVTAFAQGTPVSLRDSFPIGNSDGILCQVQHRSIESQAKNNMFDRSWAVVCRDSARPVGFAYSSRSTEQDVLNRIKPHRTEPVTCSSNEEQASLSGFRHTKCSLTAGPVAYFVKVGGQEGASYVAEGLAAYDSATLLALKSILQDTIAEGKIDVASTSVEDPFAFARVQAATLITGALRKSQLELMDDPMTSHPFYRAGFALIGDGARTFLPGDVKSLANGEISTAAQKAALN